MTITIQNNLVLRKSIAVSTLGSADLVVVGSGKKAVVVHLTLISNGIVNVKFISGSTDITGLLYLAANTGVADRNQYGLFETADGEDLKINLSGNVAVGGYMSYILIDA